MKACRKEIVRYVVPSVGSMVVTFLYIVVDGIFVGRGVGPDALAAVNLALPFAALITSLADLITMGGASVTAIRLGRGDRTGARAAFNASLGMAFSLAVAISAAGMLWTDAISLVSGSSVRLLGLTSEYIFYYSAFAIFMVMAICLSAFVRNDGRPGLAFWGMIAGAVCNIFLDWLFIFPFGMGVKVAAIASGLGQILTLAVLSVHFIGGRGELKISPRIPDSTLAGKIVKRGLPEFITQMSQPITVLCFNLVVMRELGEVGLAAYSVICYLTSLVHAVLMGVANGVQPLFGRSFGEKNRAGLKTYLRFGIGINLSLSLALYLLLAFGGSGMIGIFKPDAEMFGIASGALGVYAFSFILASVNILLTTYLFSTKRTGAAVLTAMLRSCGLNVLLIFAIPAFFGGRHLWMSITVVELVTLGAGLLILGASRKGGNTESVVLNRKMAA